MRKQRKQKGKGYTINVWLCLSSYLDCRESGQDFEGGFLRSLLGLGERQWWFNVPGLPRLGDPGRNVQVVWSLVLYSLSTSSCIQLGQVCCFTLVQCKRVLTMQRLLYLFNVSLGNTGVHAQAKYTKYRRCPGRTESSTLSGQLIKTTAIFEVSTNTTLNQGIF